MKQRISSLIVPSLIIPLFLLSGCSTAHVTNVSAWEAPTVLHILRVNKIPPNHYLPISPRTITDPHTVQRLYDAVQALPHFTIPDPPGWMSCPIDLGLEYQLDFFQERTFIQEITVPLGGCRLIQLGKQDVRRFDGAFIQLLAQTIGISETELAPAPLFSCTPHSPCLSPTPSH